MVTVQVYIKGSSYFVREPIQHSIEWHFDKCNHYERGGGDQVTHSRKFHSLAKNVVIHLGSHLDPVHFPSEDSAFHKLGGDGGVRLQILKYL